MTKGTHKTESYSVYFKLYAIQLFIDEGKSYDFITKELRLPSDNYVKEWIYLYQKYGLEGLND